MTKTKQELHYRFVNEKLRHGGCNRIKQTHKRNANEMQNLFIHVYVKLVSIYKFVEEIENLVIKT